MSTKRGSSRKTTAKSSSRSDRKKKGRSAQPDDEIVNSQDVAKMLKNLATQYTGCTMPRKEANWIQYYNDNILHALVEDNKSISHKQVPYYLFISKVVGFRLPPSMLDVPSSDLQFRLQLSLFDEKEKRFFGRTAIDEAVPALSSSSSPTDALIKDRAFVYRSSIRNSKCKGVLELVALEVRNGVTIKTVGLGWASLDLFSNSNSNLKDVSDEDAHDVRVSVNRPFYAGSPRILTFRDNSNRGGLVQAKTQRGDPVTVHYELYTYNTLQQYFHLFREHEIITQQTVISGFPITPAELLEGKLTLE